jgi:hypothetical protein
MIHMAIDPGKVCGIALWHPFETLGLKTDELSPLETIGLFEDLWRNSLGQVTVVTEKFTISERTLKTALSLDALDVNGWLTIESQRRGFELVVQTPAQAKRFSTDQKLQALNWFERTKDGHANDAARHMLVYLMKNTGAREVLIPLLAEELLN